MYSLQACTRSRSTLYRHAVVLRMVVKANGMYNWAARRKREKKRQLCVVLWARVTNSDKQIAKLEVSQERIFIYT